MIRHTLAYVIMYISVHVNARHDSTHVTNYDVIYVVKHVPTHVVRHSLANVIKHGPIHVVRHDTFHELSMTKFNSKAQLNL